MAITRKLKEIHVAELSDLITKSNIIITWDYLGLNAHEVSDIRAIIKKEDAINKVYKNRIAKIAFKNAEKSEILPHLKGPTSFLFIEDESSKALSELNKFIKGNPNVSFKAGYINGEFYDADGVAEIAGLPSKDDLLSMLLSALQGTMRNLAYSISQIAEKASEENVTDKLKEASNEA
ncbi:MAG: 50S ribosomal protein L10 [Candidatus Tyloplasma litorale]|nr:MAG: 50S ribosomal protein L10 [Mycoplasmatales bacterium]